MEREKEIERGEREEERWRGRKRERGRLKWKESERGMVTLFSLWDYIILRSSTSFIRDCCFFFFFFFFFLLSFDSKLRPFFVDVTHKDFFFVQICYGIKLYLSGSQTDDSSVSEPSGKILFTFKCGRRSCLRRW